MQRDVVSGRSAEFYMYRLAITMPCVLCTSQLSELPHLGVGHAHPRKVFRRDKWGYMNKYMPRLTNHPIASYQ